MSNVAIRRVSLTLGILAVIPFSLAAQTGTSAFVAATVKPAADSQNSNYGFRKGYFVVNNMSLRSVIQFAFDLNSSNQLVGGPSWLASTKFDINAKEEESFAKKLDAMPFDERKPLLKEVIPAFLAERFALKVHHETRELPVLALSIGKDGQKLKESASMLDTDGKAAAPKGWSGLHIDGNGNMEGRGASTEMLARMLGNQPESGGRMVVDETGLKGKYDFTLKWTPDRNAATDSSEPSLFTALQEQLGLKAKMTKQMVDVVVIDRVEMPTAN